VKSRVVPDEGAVAELLAAGTLELVDITSVSGDEGAVLARIRDHMPGTGLELIDDEDSVLFYAPAVRRTDAPFVVLAGHVDTVPAAGNVPGVRRADADGSIVVGRGSSDMKGAIAVMLEVTKVVTTDIDSDLDVGFLFFGREELPFTESALLPFFARCPLAGAIDLAVVMEPTDNAIEVGCLGNLNARVVVHGSAAHSARPWLGDNAIHRALRVLGSVADLPVRDVEIEGLVYREVISVTTIQGGIAANVVPDRVEADVNFRYAPSRTPEAAEARLRELIDDPDVEVRVTGNAPPGPVTVRNPLVERLRQAGDLSVGPKQAWTPVAEFATIGVDAVNLGPGDPQYAHREDEQVRVDALVRSYEVLRAFMAPARASVDEEGTG
jgi:succinyl-diaminopimelate desuccinylase